MSTERVLYTEDGLYTQVDHVTATMHWKLGTPVFVCCNDYYYLVGTYVKYPLVPVLTDGPYYIRVEA
jgi:hypothetical protein